MPPPRARVFLARETYRRRRLIDAIRVLPVVGLLLFFAPLVGGTGYLRSTATSGVFLFTAWFGLIVAAWGLGRLLARTPGTGDPLDPDAALRDVDEVAPPRPSPSPPLPSDT